MVHSRGADFCEGLRCRREASNWTQDDFKITLRRGLITGGYEHLCTHVCNKMSEAEMFKRKSEWSRIVHWII